MNKELLEYHKAKAVVRVSEVYLFKQTECKDLGFEVLAIDYDNSGTSGTTYIFKYLDYQLAKNRYDRQVSVLKDHHYIVSDQYCIAEKKPNFARNIEI